MIRLDGRTLTESRPIKIQDNIIFSASSSVQLSIGSTTLIVAIFKSEKKKKHNKKLKIEIDSFEQISKTEIRSLCKITTEVILQENLKFFPEYELTINVFVVENDGNLLIVLLNAISQSLKRIKLYKSKEIIFSGIGLNHKNNEFYIDPSKFESEFLKEEIYFAFIFDVQTQKIRFYQIAKLTTNYLENNKFDKNKLKKLICEFGFYLYKIFN